MQKRILIIEDETEIRKDLERTLGLSNYEAVSADDGLEGLQKAAKFKPDLIISDIMMPRLDGFSLLKELQKNPETATIPFLFLSAKSDRADIRDGMKLGADDFITKPYDIDELLDAIQIRLKKYDTNEDLHNKKFQHLTSSIQKSIPHEVRTPLSLILGYSDYLLKKFDSTSPKEAKEMLENINDAGKRLNTLFENYLFYSNLEHIASDKDELKKARSKRTFYPDLVIQEIITFASESKNRKKDLIFSLSDGVIAISEDYLTKIINELIDNAIKFSNDGTTIEVKSKIIGDKYVIIISDKGRGMTPEQINESDAFVQFERKIYEQQGSGLGLAIVKRIVEIHDGEMTLDSKLNDYTRITIKLNIVQEDSNSIY